MSRNLLTVVGAAYVVLAVWCAVAPAKTSSSVGFDLQPGSGQSEYLVIYGGLQFALGLVFLWPHIRPEAELFALTTCLIVHAAIVLFRTASFFLYSGTGTTTPVLAAVEWVILLATAAVLVRR